MVSGGYAMKKILLLSAVGALSAALAAPDANAVTILTFGQALGGDPITATANSPSSGFTTISGAGVEVDVTECFGCGPLVSPELLTLTATSVGAGSGTVSGSPAQFSQPFSGSFSIKAGVVNVLSGTFTDAVFGGFGGTSLTLSASNGVSGESVSFTSDLIPAVDLGNPEGVSFGFADVTPAVGIAGTGTLASATMSVSGTTSATVPEPATWAMLGLGFAGMGLLGLTRRRKGSRYAF
jgi:PEP-CTERM motif